MTTTAPPRTAPLRIGIAGIGTVGAGVIRLLDTNAHLVAARAGRPIEVVTDMSKSRKLGFLDYQASDEAFFDVFARLQASKLIP